MANRGGLGQRKALKANLHLLPGRTVDGLLSRYKVLDGKQQLETIRETRRQEKHAKEQQQQRLPQGGRAGSVIENWTDEEDALLWNAAQTRPSDKTLGDELRDCRLSLLPGRSLSSITNRYYLLRNRFAKEEQQRERAPKPPETPPTPPEKPPAQSPFFTNQYTSNGTTTATGINYNTVSYTPASVKVNWTPPAVEQIEIPAPAPKPSETPSPRLTDRAEEFIESLYSVVKENKDLRKQVEQLQLERANSLGKMEADLEAERGVNVRLRKQIATLEEDRDSFLRLMDKARTIGREESGIK